MATIGKVLKAAEFVLKHKNILGGGKGKSNHVAISQRALDWHREGMRSNILTIRFTDMEYETISRLAWENHKTKSDFVRGIMLKDLRRQGVMLESKVNG